MADCALDFLLEKMMQLMNSDKELVLKVCEDKLIEKKQMKWVYEEMQFLRKFVMDSDDIRSDEVKQVVTKIRGVTHHIEDIIDSFLLFNAVLQTDGSFAGVEFPLLFNRHDDMMKVKMNYFDSSVMAKKIHDICEPLMKDIDCIKRSKTEVMEILSWLESDHMPTDDGVINVIQVEEETKSLIKLIKQVMEIYDKESSSLRWLDSSDDVVLLRNLSEKVLYWSEKNPDPFVRTESWSGKCRLHIPWFVPLFFYKFDEMLTRSNQIHRQFSCVIEELKLIVIQVDKIYDKGWSSVAHMSDRFRLLSNSFQQIIRLPEKIHREFGSVIEESSKVLNTTKAMKVVKCRITEFVLPTLAYVEMHQGLGDVIEDIKFIKGEVMEIYEKEKYDTRAKKVPQITSSSHRVASKPTNPGVVDEIVVGLDDDKNTIMELLVGVHEKDLKFIAIVGMAGLGKTTLARNLYNDPYIMYHFYIRAWTTVSQVYQKRDLLLDILSSAGIQIHYNIGNMSDEELGEHFYKAFKGKRYFLVMDDLWESGAWHELKRYFPNDRNGSRILVTSRLVNVAVALQAKPRYLRLLNENESWNLLCLKVFRKNSCPIHLIEIGKELARKCGGLPLAIIVVSGLLVKKDKTEGWWRHVSESLSSYINSDQEQVIDALALSYNHLPRYLKPCFVYFGAFPEDYEIHVRQLIWLWVAEGFIRQNEHRDLEEVAEDYLIDRIDRGLVIVSKKRSDGRIKACRVHDLLRDLCLRKAEEDNFLLQISRYEQSSYSCTNPFAHKQRRLCIHDDLVHCTSFKHSELYIRSFLSFGRSFHDLRKKDVSFVCQAFKLLRVLNLLSIKVLFVPKELEQLVHMRYLALHVEQEHFEPSISNLWNLETIIIDGPNGSFYLYDIWKMVNLRHVYSTRPIQIHGRIPDGSPSVLDKLQSIGKLHGGHVLALFPNLKKLKCQHDGFPELDFLEHLETLNLIYNGSIRFFHLDRFSHLDSFPPNLKSLTLSNFLLPWDQMSTLGRLPYLEVLKLSYKAFEGPNWKTSDGEFCRLRFLKLQGLDIKQWNTSSDHFASLQTLVLEECRLLEKIPSSLGDVSTLEMIQVSSCNFSTAYSAKQIQDHQHAMGNDVLKVVITSLDPDEVVIEDVEEDDDE